MFQRLMLQPIKMEHYFDSEGWNIKDGVQDGRQLGFKTYMTNRLDKNALNLTFYEYLDAEWYKRSN